MNLRFISVAVLCALVSFAPTNAQTAAELLTAVSISSTLDSGIRLPSGSFSVTNPKYAQQFASMLGADANKYNNYELHVATGVAKKLAGNFIGQLETNFATAGYWKTTSATATVGKETRTRTEFTNEDNGKTLLLFVVVRQDSVYFLVGQKK